jgi:hypothetical protein
MVVLRSGLFPRLGEYSNVGSEFGKKKSAEERKTTASAKQPPFGICDIRSLWLQVPSFPRARPRMCRREDWVVVMSTKGESPATTACPKGLGKPRDGTDDRSRKEDLIQKKVRGYLSLEFSFSLNSFL